MIRAHFRGAGRWLGRATLGALLVCGLWVSTCRGGAQTPDPAGAVPPDDAIFTPGQETKILDPATGGLGYYVVWVPKDYAPDRAWPTIFNYHGLDQNPQTSPFREVTGGKGFIVIGMEFLKRAVGQQSPTLEVSNLKRIATYLGGKLKVDENLVFMGGFSQGGFQTIEFSNLCMNNLAGIIILCAGGAPGGAAVRQVQGKPVFIGVGEHDPYNADGRAAQKSYAQAGAVVTFEEEKGFGHSPNPQSQMLREWLLTNGSMKQAKAVVDHVPAVAKAATTAPSARPAQARDAHAIDLLALAANPLPGSWKRNADGLSNSVGHEPVELSMATQGDYDLHVEFTRLEGTGDVDVIIPVGSRQTMVLLSGWNGQRSGLMLVDGKPAGPAGTLENAHRYSLDVRVRIQDPRGSISVKLDGQTVIDWQGDLASLSVEPAWKIKDASAFGLGVYAPAVFHLVRLHMISGQARRL